MNQAYSRLSTTHGHITDYKLDSVVYGRNTRRTMTDDPFMAVWNLYARSKTKTAVYLQSELDGADFVQVDTEERKLRVSESDRKESKLYVELNPSLSESTIYTHMDVLEHERIAATRLCLSSHDLAVERGRWSRIPIEQCLCLCGDIQTVEHVTCKCRLTSSIRDRMADVNFFNAYSFWTNDAPSTRKVTFEKVSYFNPNG